MDLRKAIEKLNSIDANDLKNFDFGKLKEYNVSRLKEDLAAKPNLLIKAAFIILTVLIVIYSLSSYRALSSGIRVQETEIQQRLDMIKEKVAAEEGYKAFISKYPKAVPINQLIGKISEFAERANVKIISFSPVKTSESNYITQYSINLDVETDTYQNVVDFIHIIENAPYTLRINRVTGRALGGYSAKYQGEKDVPLNAYIEIGSIQLNDV